MEGHFEHACIIDGGLIKSCEDGPALFQSANQPFNNIAVTISLLVKVLVDGNPRIEFFLNVSPR